MLGIFTAVSTLATTWLEGRNAKQKANLAMDKAEAANKVRLLESRMEYNKEWEIAQLRDKDKSLRWVSFVVIASPFIVAIFAPDAVNYYFTVALAGVPDWWIKAFMGITGAIWGLSSLKNIAPAVLNAFKRKAHDEQK